VYNKSNQGKLKIGLEKISKIKEIMKLFKELIV